MPRNKDLKRLVRARMRKTGEAYTAARAQVVDKPRTAAAARHAAANRAEPVVSPAPDEYAARAGMKDDVIQLKTGRTWQGWVQTLDGEGAGLMTHRDIAALVNTKFEVDGWWSQTVTVGYERIKGLRERGQRRDGTWEAAKSRTYPVPVTTLFDAWANARLRRRWMDGTSVTVRTATAPKSMRLGWSDGTIVVVGFDAKGKSKSSVAVQHTRLPDRETATRLKQFWAESLDVLAEFLAGL